MRPFCHSVPRLLWRKLFNGSEAARAKPFAHVPQFAVVPATADYQP